MKNQGVESKAAPRPSRTSSGMGLEEGDSPDAAAPPEGGGSLGILGFCPCPGLGAVLAFPGMCEDGFQLFLPEAGLLYPARCRGRKCWIFFPISVCVQSWRSSPFLAAAPSLFDPSCSHPGLKSIVMLKTPALQIQAANSSGREKKLTHNLLSFKKKKSFKKRGEKGEFSSLDRCQELGHALLIKGEAVGNALPLSGQLAGDKSSLSCFKSSQEKPPAG